MATSYRSLEAGMLVAGEYRIVRILGEGGMGAVYLAEQVSTGASRALKVMHGDLARSATFRKRFAQEARASARIPSDHVVQVIAAGVDEALELPWIAMELLEGETLDVRVDNGGPLSTDETYSLFDALCHGLGAAHQMGIVHRDLKPQNIFLAASRRRGETYTPKVVDFGIAKITAEAQTSVTGPMGTPLWMSPEQTVPGSEVAAPTDIWAIGLLVFYTLTGARYWLSAHHEDASVLALLRELTLEPIEAASARAARFGLAHLIPSGFDPWFDRCTRRDPRERFPHAIAATEGLRHALGLPAIQIASASASALVAEPPLLPALTPPTSLALGSEPSLGLERTHLVHTENENPFGMLAASPFGPTVAAPIPPPLVENSGVSLARSTEPPPALVRPPTVDPSPGLLRPASQRSDDAGSGSWPFVNQESAATALATSTPLTPSPQTVKSGGWPGGTETPGGDSAPPPRKPRLVRGESTTGPVIFGDQTPPAKKSRTPLVAIALAVTGLGIGAAWMVQRSGTGVTGAASGTGPAITPASSGSGSKPAAASAIRVCGTSIVDGAFKSWAASYARSAPSMTLNFENMGSGPAIAALLDGTAEMAVSSRLASADEVARGKAAGFDLSDNSSRYALALDALAIVVHPNNPTVQLSLGELRDMFTGKVREWSAFGQGAGQIELILRPEEFGEHQSFTNLVFRDGDKYMGGAEVIRAGKDVQLRISKSLPAVSYVSFSLVGGNKTLKIGTRSGSIFYAPSTTSIRDRSYPLIRPLYLYTRGAPQGVLKDLITHVQDHAESVLASVGLVSPRITFVEDKERGGQTAASCKADPQGRKRASADIHFRSGPIRLDEMGEIDLAMVAKAACGDAPPTFDLLETGAGESGTARAKWVGTKLGELCPGARVECVADGPPVAGGARAGRSVEIWIRKSQ